jgi:hypothetical protein
LNEVVDEQACNQLEQFIAFNDSKSKIKNHSINNAPSCPMHHSFTSKIPSDQKLVILCLGTLWKEIYIYFQIFLLDK